MVKKKRVLTKEQKEKAKIRSKKWLENNKQKNRENQKKYRAKRYKEDGFWRDSGPKAKAQKEWMLEIKSNPCADCGGVFEICCMDFDHINPTIKEYDIGAMFAHHYSNEAIKKELVKCELVCANCHRIRTRDRRTGNGRNKV